MKTSEEGVELIRHFEGFSAMPYRDPAGIPTIGYGSIWRDDGSRVTMNDDPVTEEQAEAMLMREVRRAEHAVMTLITVPLTEAQFSALVSFTYNLGSGALQRSTLRQKLNRLDYAGAADEFHKWRMAGGRVLAGLVRRRREEVALWESSGADAVVSRNSLSSWVSSLLSHLWPRSA